MGIFGYEPENKAVKPMDAVPEELERAIRDRLNKDKRLACASAWEIAKAFNLPKMHVSSACERLGIKIKPCQLGSFKDSVQLSAKVKRVTA
jgi:PIN domain nuclease of toxin-antitoxin system